MKNRSAVHATFVIERAFSVAPARVFAAWASPEGKAKWFAPPADWKREVYEMDFRVGGTERMVGGPVGHEPHSFDARYLDIVPDERIVYAYEMHLGDKKISVSLATIEIAADGKGTRMKMTEQGVFLDGYDDAGSREQGTIQLMKQFENSLKS